MRQALKLVSGQLGCEYDLILSGHRLKTKEKILSMNPARPGQVIGIHQKASVEHAELAMIAAHLAFETWSRTDVESRVSLLLNAAEIIRQRAFEFRAWLTFEAGKNWAEADADVGETIDFLEFYAREALRLAAAKPPNQYPGERNELHYIPLGIGVVISPWNFPFAIMAGMTIASLVTGNVAVTIGGLSAQVLYQGAAPLAIAGLTQINALIPAGVAAGSTVQVRVTYGAASNTVSIAVK